MAEMDFAATRAAPRNRVKARELVPCYRAGAGPASFRHGMPEHERSVIDAALAILGRYLGEPGAAFDSPEAVRVATQLVALQDVAEGGFFKRMSDDFWLWWESE